MKYFKASGQWFLDEAPQHRVPGTLTYSKRGLHLRLLGGFKEGWIPTIETYPLIRGVVGGNPYGPFITLSDCFTQQTTFSLPGAGEQVITCNRGIAGETHVDPDHDSFKAISLRISYLSQWFKRTGISTEILPGERYGQEIHYRQPDRVACSIGQTKLDLRTSARLSRSSNTFEIQEEALLDIEPAPQLTAKQIISEYARPLQNLLSFATDRPNAIEEIELRGEEVEQGGARRNRKYHLLYEPIFRLKKRETWLGKGDLLFDFDDAQEAGLNLFERWFAFAGRHQAFCTVYFAALYAPARYLDERFLRLMSAFTLLTASLVEVSTRTARFLDEVRHLASERFTEEELGLIGPILPNGAEMEMPIRLLEQLKEHGAIMSQIVGDDFARFVQSISDTLAHAERRCANDSASLLRGGDLLDAMEKIQILLKAIVLKELGFDESQTARFLGRNRAFASLRNFGSEFPPIEHP